MAKKDVVITEELDYSTLIDNCYYVYTYYDTDLVEHKIDYTLDVVEDDDNIYVITTKEIITLPKSGITDKTSVDTKKKDKKDKEVQKWLKAQEKMLKELNKQIKKGTLKRVVEASDEEIIDTGVE